MLPLNFEKPLYRNIEEMDISFNLIHNTMYLIIIIIIIWFF